MEFRHQADRKRFVALLEDAEAQISYEIPREDVLDLSHTYVPDQARGQGVADKLVEYALRYAREHGKKIVPSCSYVKKWIDAHPDWQDLLAE